MNKWCLNLKLLSSAAYHSLRSSGFVKLPERTLRDYTHFFKSKPGFQVEEEQILMKEIRVDTMSDYDFLGYLKQWEESVQARRDVADSGKTKMLLSRETLEGLYITGKCEIIRIKLYLMFSVIINGVINFTYC